MTATPSDIAALESRIQALEDRQEILHVLMTHPHAVDGGAADYWMSHWTDDGQVDRLQDPDRHSGDYSGTYGKDLMREEILSPELEALRKIGLSHFVTVPAIHIDGDRAHATNYLQLIEVDGNGYRNRRLVVSRWELRRDAGRWRISKRTIRPLGHPEALALVRSSLGQS